MVSSGEHPSPLAPFGTAVQVDLVKAEIVGLHQEAVAVAPQAPVGPFRGAAGEAPVEPRADYPYDFVSLAAPGEFQWSFGEVFIYDLDLFRDEFASLWSLHDQPQFDSI